MPRRYLRGLAPCPPAPRLAAAAALATLTALAACEPGGPPATFAVGDTAGVREVRNLATEWSTPPAWTVDPDPALTLEGPFFRVARVRLRRGGGLVVLDGGEAVLHAYDGSGRLTMTAAGEGDGPGELRAPRELYLLPGDTMMVWDRANRNVFAADGSFERRATAAGNVIQEAFLPERNVEGFRGLPDGAVLAVGYGRGDSGAVSGRFRWSMLFARAALDGSRIDTLGLGWDREWWIPSSGTGRGRTLLGPSTLWTAGGTPMRIAIADNARPTVHVYEPDGALRTVVRLPETDRSVPPALLRAAREQRRDVQAPAAALERFLAAAPDPEELPALGGLLFDDEGNLWVLPYVPDEGRSAWSGVASAMVIDSAGILRGSVALPEGLVVHDVLGDRLVGVHTDDLDVERIQVHVLSRR